MEFYFPEGRIKIIEAAIIENKKDIFEKSAKGQCM